MQVTIVGLPGSGKTTVYNALTGGHAETGGFSGSRAAPNVSVVKVPDERVDRLAALFVPKKTTYADVTYVDVAIPAGAAREGTVNPDVLAQLRNADALLHVVRAFDDPAAAAASDPWRDVEDLDLEFTVADLTVIEKRLEKLKTQGRHGSQAERDQAQREQELLERIEPHLSDSKPIRSFGLTGDEEFLLRGYRFLTQKPVLVVLNIDEARLPEAVALEVAGRERYGQPQTDVAALAGKIEAEIGELPEEDARLFMDDLGIAEPSRGRVISLTYALLGPVQLLHRWGRRVSGMDPSHRLNRGGCRRGDPLRFGARLHPRRDDRRGRPAGVRQHRGGSQARPPAPGGKDLPGSRRRRAADPVQRGPLGLLSSSATIERNSSLGSDQVVVGICHADAHRGAQLLVADVREAVVALELAGNRLDEGVLLECVEHRGASRVHHRRELLWGMVALRSEEGIGHQVRCALVELVKEESHQPMIDR